MSAQPKALHTQISIETITPHKASTLLGTMIGNRPLRNRIVKRYAREMIAHKWQLNGEAIKIARTGRLIDGQHRLQAVIMANVEVQMAVVRGLDEDTVVTLDTGIGRSYHDSAIIRGLHYPDSAGPIARWWYKYQMGSPTVATYVATHQELDYLITEHPSIVESARFIQKLKTVRLRCVASVQGFVHAYVTEAWERDAADLFQHALNDGTALQQGDPVYLLRKRLIEVDRERPESTRVLALTIKAWNAWIEGRKLQNLKWQAGDLGGGKTGEPFPRFGREIAKTNGQGSDDHRSIVSALKPKRRLVTVA